MHSICGVFLTTMSSLQRRIPNKDYVEEEPKLREQFMQGYLDATMEHVLSSTGPPLDLTNLPFLRQAHTHFWKHWLL